MEEIFKKLNIKVGINMNRERLNNLRFADYIILFAETVGKLRNLLEDVNREGKKDGMKMNK
jgi:hypothetical protein